jgi:hypothetical protein
MKLVRVLVAALMLTLLLGASPALAAGGHSGHGGNNDGGNHNGGQSQPLNLLMQGVITNAGTQHYQFGGGQVVAGTIGGNPVSTDQIQFELQAIVNGLGASGSGFLSLGNGQVNTQGGGNGHGHGHGRDVGYGTSSSGQGYSFSAQIEISGAISAAVFPLVVNPDGSATNCLTSCSSMIPLFFTGTATIQSGGNEPLQIPIEVESPYWSPFGGPILIVSLDSPTNPYVYLLVNTDTATIGWSGVQLVGQIASGTYGSETVTGAYAQVVNSQEDLVSGNEFDGGSIAFLGMSDSSLNSQGFFVGQTSFTLTGSFNCDALFNLPSQVPCTATGATSGGSFLMNGQGALITGKYSTAWSVPSLFTVTTIVGAVYQQS